MSNKVGFPAVTQDVFVPDMVSTSYGNPTYCGDRSYSLSIQELPMLLSRTNTFLSISGSTIVLQTNDPNDVGNFLVKIAVSLANYNLVASHDFHF
jgi:hypothetical protein